MLLPPPLPVSLSISCDRGIPTGFRGKNDWGKALLTKAYVLSIANLVKSNLQVL